MSVLSDRVQELKNHPDCSVLIKDVVEYMQGTKPLVELVGQKPEKKTKVIRKKKAK